MSTGDLILSTAPDASVAMQFLVNGDLDNLAGITTTEDFSVVRKKGAHTNKVQAGEKALTSCAEFIKTHATKSSVDRATKNVPMLEKTERKHNDKRSGTNK